MAEAEMKFFFACCQVFILKNFCKDAILPGKS
jgi:hypothetical protein